MPTGGECHSCGAKETWGEVIRGCYARKEGTEREIEAQRKQTQKSVRPRRKQAIGEVDESEKDHGPSSSMSSLSIASPTKKSRIGKRNA